MARSQMQMAQTRRLYNYGLSLSYATDSALAAVGNILKVNYSL